MTPDEIAALRQRNRDLERRVRRVIHAAHLRTADHVRGILRGAVTEWENRRLKAALAVARGDNGATEQPEDVRGGQR